MLIVLIRVADAVICEGIPDITSCRSEASEAIANVNVNIGDLLILAQCCTFPPAGGYIKYLNSWSETKVVL